MAMRFARDAGSGGDGKDEVGGASGIHAFDKQSVSLPSTMRHSENALFSLVSDVNAVKTIIVRDGGDPMVRQHLIAFAGYRR